MHIFMVFVIFYRILIYFILFSFCVILCFAVIRQLPPPAFHTSEIVLRIEGPGDRKCRRVVAPGGRLYLYGSDLTVATAHHRGFTQKWSTPFLEMHRSTA
ncbi:hypothetical protein PUN28_001285 [Cardiocondyla obscurior]|uniref:Secreted protein n=1 Tax=Cardiocondyla obscurior TaxID=286306 RepID=A0AAW2H490_9HYME